MLSIKTPKSTAELIADRLRQRRLALGYSREELAERAGETVSCIKRFELSGEIALKKLLNLAFVLDAMDTFDAVLLMPPPMTMKALKREAKVRKRGRRRK